MKPTTLIASALALGIAANAIAITRALAAPTCTLTYELQDPQWIERQVKLTTQTLRIAGIYIDLCESGKCETISPDKKSAFKKAVDDRVGMLEKIVACTGGKGS